MNQRSPIERLDDYDVTWNTPSDNAAGSMPLGNGDLALNAWIEPNGDLLLLLAKSDAWDEHAINLKLGRLRVTLSPPLCTDPAGRFQQTLRLANAEIYVDATDVRLRLWIDANRPVIHLDIDADRPCDMRVAVESWRTAPRTIRTQTSDMFKNLAGKNADPFPTVVAADHFLPDHAGRFIAWCHHNEKRDPDPFLVNLKLQGLSAAAEQMPHPLLGRTFGAAVEGHGFVAEGASLLRSASAGKSHRLRIHGLTQHPSTISNWMRAIQKQIDLADEADDWEKHVHWWRDFWERSWIFVTSKQPSEAEAVFHVTQAYVLQRFMNAAAGRGTMPIKHNGSLFSVGNPDDPDFRRWGGPGFWFQNQRLIYWPMLASGDFDLLRIWLDMYAATLPLQRLRTERYFHHTGAHFPETITFWGAEVSAHYGWTPFENRQKPEAESPYLAYYWTGGIELVLLMCEYFNYTADEAFARSTLLPVAQNVIDFFRVHYPRDPSGRIRFSPAQSLETWHEAVNPLPEIAGLRYLLEKLLNLPNDLVSAELRESWSDLLQELPSLPIGQNEGVTVIRPAETFSNKKNTENPELYCIFPYRLFGVGKADLQLARDTFAHRLHQLSECWSQDEIQMALLGLADDAKQFLTRRASPTAHSDSRFPGFWNAFHDWVPDVDHAGVLQMALQLMLLQADDSQILLFPAWPAEWDADFRLHAPGGCVFEGAIRGGNVVDLQATESSTVQEHVTPITSEAIG